MKNLILPIFFICNVAHGYEVYEPNSGATIYVKWCDPITEEIKDLKYIGCGDSTDNKLSITGACSNIQSDCGQQPPDYPVQTYEKKANDKVIGAKKKWEYFNLEQAAKVGHPSAYKPASSDEPLLPRPKKKSVEKTDLKK